MAKLFFLVSGEHPTLPLSELESILKAEGHKYRLLEKLPHVLRIETSIESIESVKSRAALTRVCCLEIVTSKANLSEILKKLRFSSLDEFIKQGESFAVRVKRIRRTTTRSISLKLERKIGEYVHKTIKGSRVNLTAPQKTFLGILTGKWFVLGLKVAEISPKTFIGRRPRKRPFFHPTAMPAKLARCMLNLAQPQKSDLVLDPFCGTASILIEAWLIGCRVLGCDVQPRMIKGGLQNFQHFGVEPEGMVVADARNLPVTRVDCIVTDPPYGRSATTLGWESRRIFKDFLSGIEHIVPKGKKICMAAPKATRIRDLAKELEFKHLNSYFVYVHRSLTREILVFEKT